MNEAKGNGKLIWKNKSYWDESTFFRRSSAQISGKIDNISIFKFWVCTWVEQKIPKKGAHLDVAGQVFDLVSSRDTSEQNISSLKALNVEMLSNWCCPMLILKRYFNYLYCSFNLPVISQLSKCNLEHWRGCLHIYPMGSVC